MLLTHAYYLLKPAMPRRLRLALRRFRANRLSHRVNRDWPINQVAGRIPHGWPGWPGGKQFAFVLTHDVEGKGGLDRCRQLAEMDMRLGFRSSFNFVPEGAYITSDSLREFLTKNGFEVGVQDLHHNGKLYLSKRKFTANAVKINRYLAAWGAVGFRSGLMFHELSWLRDLNILYDSSTFDSDPFEPQPDGVHTVFPFWVPRDDGSGYVELPYTLPQDSTLFLLFQETSIATWTRKLDWVAKQGGMALVNVHPDYMSFDGRWNSSEYGAHLYEQLLEYVATRYGPHCWFALPRDVAAYVRANTALHPGPRVEGRPSREPIHDSEPVSSGSQNQPVPSAWRLRGKRAAMVLYSHYPADPRPRRAAEALVNEGMTVEIICLTAARTDPKHETLKGIDIRRVPLKRRRTGIFGYVFQYAAFLSLSFAILAMRSLTRHYELVYVHNMPDILVLSTLVPKALGAKVILDLHDPMPELMMTIFNLRQDAAWVRILRRLEKWSIHVADLALTVNIACQKLFAARSCRPEKIKVVMNSPDEEIFRFRPPRSRPLTIHPPSAPFVIMYHGSLVERNGLDLAVEALAHLRRSVPSAELRIYGSQTHFLGRVMDSARAKRLHQAVRYLGQKGLEDIVQAIDECHVGIIPNHRSIFTEINTPTRIFEYLALGKPVIAPRARGIQDYFDSDSLIFFELGDSHDLARKLEYVFLHSVETVEIVKRGQEVYRAHTWPQERQRLVALAAELLTIPDSRH